MQYTAKKLEKSQMELIITVTPAEYKHAMEHAAEHMSERAAIKGFRPGKAPYAIVKEQLGEIKIMEEALEHIVQENFFQAVQKEKIETVGAPQISIEKMAPGNDLIFKAVVALLPKVTLPDINSIKVEQKTTEVSQKQVDEVVENLKKMQRKEKTKTGSAQKEDKMVIDMDMFVDKVPMEGGQAKDYQVYLSEDHYIPGFGEQLVGLKKDEEKEFSLKFPKEHFQKQFAGKDVDIKVRVKDVLELTYPEADDTFAKALGQDSLAKLQDLLKHNLLHEAEQKEEQRIEVAILEQLIEKSQFEDIPEILIKSEKNKIFFELKHSLEKHGVTIEQYLKDLKKTEEEIFKDFTEQAIQRAKSALLSRQIAMENDIKVEKKELDDEIAGIRTSYGDDKNVEENLKRPDVIDTIATTIQNRKVLKFLKEKILDQNSKSEPQKNQNSKSQI
ncbi:trigger factor, partial [Patescibacteria group bacterium]|nr:trigger factor [Patescibacteria group bacterium]